MRDLVRIAFLSLLVVLSGATFLRAEGVPSQADLLYQQALNSFLSGDYDKALLLAAQTLEKDPTHSKTKNLISVLAAEKEQEGKTVIWLAGKPALVPLAQASVPVVREDKDLRADLEALRDKVGRYYQSLSGRQDSLEGRAKALQGLLQDNNLTQYQEVRASQEAIYRKLEQIEKGTQGQDLKLLYLLCGGSLLLSLLALARKRPKG